MPHQYGISALVSQTSFRRETSGVSCFFSQVSIKERGFSNKSNSWPLVLERKDKNQKPRDKAFSPAVMTSFRLKLHHEFIREITLSVCTQYWRKYQPVNR